MKRLGWRGKVILAACGVAAGLAVADGVAGAFAPVHAKPYRLDERLLYAPIPGSRRQLTQLKRNGGATVDVRINSLGFRGPELAGARQGERIVVYGDSFIEGDFSAEPETFACQLQRDLAAAGDVPVEVVNAGVVGYGPDQVARRMAVELPELRPDLVVVAVYAGNDFGDLLRNKLYRLDGRGRLTENRFRLSPRVQKEFKQPSRWGLVRLLKKAYWRVEAYRTAGTTVTESESARAGRYIPRSLRECIEEYESFVVEGDDTVKQLSYDHYDADIALAPHSPSATYKIAMMREVLRRIRDEAAARRVPLLTLVIPSPVDVVSDYYWSVDRSVYPEYEPRRLTDTVAAIVQDLQVPYVDLYDAFSTDDPRTLYFSFGDNHWDARGQALAARLVTAFVQERGLLAGRDR